MKASLSAALAKAVSGTRKNRLAVRDGDTIPFEDHLADPLPLEVMLDLVGGEAKAALILRQPDGLIEGRATLELGDPEFP